MSGDQKHGCPPLPRFEPDAGEIPALAQEKGASEYVRGFKSAGCHAETHPLSGSGLIWVLISPVKLVLKKYHRGQQPAGKRSAGSDFVFGCILIKHQKFEALISS